MLSKLKDFISQCARVWQITRKPTNEEFKVVSQASALGMLIIGLIGFAVAALIKVTFKF
jgi:protein transport protein SEC61 subunit gamma-like protein